MKQCYGLTLLVLWGLTLSFYEAAAQPLAVGAAVPDLELQGVRNHTSAQLRLSDFRGKLLILDFWSVNCSSCISDFRKVDSLQQKFGDKVQFLLVTKNDQREVEALFQRVKKLRMPSVPLLTGDTVLSRYFPYQFVPHHVWISPEGRVHAITYGANANVGQLQSYLDGRRTVLATKKDSRLDGVDWGLALGTAAAQRENLLYYSYLTGYQEGLGTSSRTKSSAKNNHTTEISINNASILTLYKVAFGAFRKADFMDHQNTVLLHLKDPSKYTEPQDVNALLQWARLNWYCYRLKVPAQLSAQFFVLMQQDLVRLFGWRARIEQRKISCWVLVRTGKLDQLASKGGPMRSNFHVPSDTLITLRNYPFDYFSWRLKERFDGAATPEPFVDATGYKGKVDMNFRADAWHSWDPADLTPLRTELRKQGLDLVRQVRQRDVLVIRDK